MGTYCGENDKALLLIPKKFPLPSMMYGTGNAPLIIVVVNEVYLVVNHSMNPFPYILFAVAEVQYLSQEKRKLISHLKSSQM